MNFAEKIYLYFIILLTCSTIITVAGIYGFQQLEPAIDLLNSSNTQSLYYSEQMLTSISAKKDLNTFKKNLDLADKNITEPGEKEVIEKIAADYLPAFRGNKIAEEHTVNDIAELTRINRVAMEQSGVKAKKQEAMPVCCCYKRITKFV